MGNVELEDQVVGIQTAAQVAPYIDLSRVAIIGWSYGINVIITNVKIKKYFFRWIHGLTWYFKKA